MSGLPIRGMPPCRATGDKTTGDRSRLTALTREDSDVQREDLIQLRGVAGTAACYSADARFSGPHQFRPSSSSW